MHDDEKIKVVFLILSFLRSVEGISLFIMLHLLECVTNT